jgi:thymidylate synthase
MHPEQQYLDLLSDIMENGVKKPIFSPNGKLGTIDKRQYSEINSCDKWLYSVFGRQLRFNLTESFPLYTTKKVHYPSAFKEMLWFFNGNGNVAALHQSGVPVWNGWAYKKYLKESEEPKLEYSAFVAQYLDKGDYFIEVPYTDFVDWDCDGISINQTNWLIDSIKINPERKSYVVSGWNPSRLYGMSQISGKDSVALAACHSFHQVVVNNGKLSLMVYIRSNDMPLGHPFNVAQYALLTRMYAHCTGFEAHDLVVTIGDAHIYSDQFDGIKEQLISEPKAFPDLHIEDRGQKYLSDFRYSDFTVKNYASEKSIPMPLTIVGGF